MSLIKSVSGIRGTIGGKQGDNLTPLDIVKFTTAYTYIIRKKTGKKKLKIIVGRDARLSGELVQGLVVSTLSAMGADVTDIGLATTPTVEIAVVSEKADGGIILTASHNPKQWNALKLLNENGEFISGEEGEELLAVSENIDKFIEYSEISGIGIIKKDTSFLKKHIDLILKCKYVEVSEIKKANFKIVIDSVNSVGGIALPPLLKALGVTEIIELNGEPTGIFAHNPEPIPENLSEISEAVKKHKADLGFVVDPDVDRLAIINEDGTMFGEEYTLVAVADYILSQKKGNTVSNLSSTRALSDITQKYGGNYFASAVGEVNVVKSMKENKAVIGGEGNGGIILPELHYGRDALIGIALFLTHLAKFGKKCSDLRNTYPSYYISKNKISLTKDTNVDEILNNIKEKYISLPDIKVNTIDGVKIDFLTGWVHLRKSNTEPIIRIYAESKSEQEADEFANEIKRFVNEQFTMNNLQ